MVFTDRSIRAREVRYSYVRLNVILEKGESCLLGLGKVEVQKDVGTT
jgi:hypothetical protein